MAGLGAKMQAASDSAKQKAEEMKLKAEEAIKSKNGDASVPTEVDTAIAPVVSEEASVSSGTPAKKISVRDSFTEFTKQFKKEEEEAPISDLVEVLSTLFDFDPRAKKPHEMVEALELQGINTWRGFLLMAEEDIPQLTKNSKDGEVPISKNAIRMLTYLKQFTIYNITSGVENAKDPSLYTSEAFDAYVEDLQLGRKSAFHKEDEHDNKKSTKERMDNMRASISGFATNFKPGFVKVEEGSITDILNKTQWKVFKKDKETEADEATSEADVSSTELAEVDPHNEEAFERMKKNVDDLASRLEATAKDGSAKTKEEVQKLMVPLLSKLKASQDKFAHMMEARKKKKEDNGEAEEETADAAEEEGEVSNGNGNKEKFKNLLSSAENATKRAFENAEKVARQAAKRAGIYDKEQAAAGEEAPSVPAQSGCKTEEAV